MFQIKLILKMLVRLAMIEKINAIVQQAGKIALDYFGRVEIDYKQDNSVVTEADLSVEKFLREKLTELIPSSGFLGEESETDPENLKREFLWIVDPIDGTSSYCNRLPIWGVSVALFQNFQPYMASLFFPYVNEMFWADGRGAAYENNLLMNPIKGNLEIRPDSFICIPSKIYYRCMMKVHVKARSFGSTCYHILQAARDSAYATLIGDYRIWDLAGAITLSQITGARVFNLKGEIVPTETYFNLGLDAEPLILAHPDRVQKVLDKIEIKC